VGTRPGHYGLGSSSSRERRARDLDSLLPGMSDDIRERTTAVPSLRVSRVSGATTAELRVVMPPALAATIPLGAERTTLGRQADGPGEPEIADVSVSRKHFAIEWDASSGFHTGVDLGSSNGTFVNGIRIQEHQLQTGECFTAGQSVFQIEFSLSGSRFLADVLSTQDEPLYAVLDTARDPTMYSLLLTSGAYYWCLYAGNSALTMESVAPYLVYLPPGSEFLTTIINKGWSKSWGIFLTSGRAPEEIWHDLRRHLFVDIQSKGRVYFRFYDPRVLRMFMPISTDQQRVDFGGIVSSFLMEDEDPKVLLRFASPWHGSYLEKMDVYIEKTEEQASARQELASTRVL